eukprot:XP_024999641.1 T-complex protein 11 homolog isoform X4 [Gallus gallus]
MVTQHLPGEPIPVLNNPFCKEVFPDIQPKLPLVQLEAISPHPVTSEKRPAPLCCNHLSVSSPQILSTNELQELSDEVFRLSTVHEIVLNADLKVHMVNFPPHSLENRVKETLHKAFWDRLKKQISASPPDYTQAIQLLQEIKEALLLLLLPQNSQLRSQIEGVLDLELIRQEAEHGALDIHGLSTSILSTMAMLCAPFRDEEVQGLQSLTDPVELLREIFRVLDLMKMDMLNFTIQNLRPYLQECYVQYEQEKFQKILDKLPNSLDNTTEWLRRAAAAEVSASSLQSQSCPATSSSPDAHFQGAVNSNTTVPSAMSVLNRGYMDLLCWEPGQNEYPETLLLDQARLQEVQAQVNQLTIIAAVLLVTSGVCGSTLFDSPGFIARLKLVTKVLLEGLSSISEKCTSLKGQIRSIADKGNAVRNIIKQRIHLFLSLFISPDGQKSQKDFPKGLDAIQEELQEVGHRFRSVTYHNRQVFGPFYSAILKKVLFPEAEPDSGRDSM